jgi:OOP family OmpA-OmpF porin
MNKIFFYFCFFLCSLTAWAQTADKGKEYPDSHGGIVYFPLGDMSFADEVVSFQEGSPFAKDEKFRRSRDILGIPDVENFTGENALSLGCGGTIILRFIDNALTDVQGPDLYVFEIGPAVEPTSLAISKNNIDWIEIGKISGGRADIDISTFVKPGDFFYYVKLTDLKSDCATDWPGADIDAVGTIGSAMQLSLNSSVLFDVNKYKLKPEAKNTLIDAANKIKEYPGASVLIEGHTDNVGTDEMNQILSENRAKSVKDFFISQQINSALISIAGFGESHPIATNETEEGKQKNRRVTVVIKPHQESLKHRFNTRFIKYSLKHDEAETGYPKSFSDKVFPGVWKEGIDDALYLGDQKIYFFKGSEFVTYNLNTQTIDPGYPKSITESWPGLWPDGIDASINWSENKVYFFKGDQCMLYDIGNRKPVSGYPKKIIKDFKGVWTEGIDAAYNKGNGKIYFFKGIHYLRYDIGAHQKDADYPFIIDGYWPGLFTKDVSAVIKYSDEHLYFFQNPPRGE